MTKIAFNCKTHFSLLKAFSKCDELARKCSEYGYTSCVLCDIKTIAGVVDFHKSCRKYNIKPIIGCDFEDFILVAKNKDGWFELIKYISDSDLVTLKEIASSGNMVCISPKSSYKKIFSHFIELDYDAYGSYYVNKDDADCHRVLLCSGMKKTIPQVAKMIKSGEQFD